MTTQKIHRIYEEHKEEYNLILKNLSSFSVKHKLKLLDSIYLIVYASKEILKDHQSKNDNRYKKNGRKSWATNRKQQQKVGTEKQG